MKRFTIQFYNALLFDDYSAIASEAEAKYKQKTWKKTYNFNCQTDVLKITNSTGQNKGKHYI